MPFAAGWYAVIRKCVASIALIWLNNLDSNCLPWSMVMRAAVSNQDIQPLMKVFATVSASMLAIGKASGQRVYLSTQVRQYLFPSELGRYAHART